MDLHAREHVVGLTTLLTVVSLGLVFGAVLGYVPPALLPRASGTTLAAIPHVNAVLSTVAIATLLLGVAFVRRGEIRRHRAMMLTTFGLFVAFLLLYLYKVALSGTAEFGGPPGVYRFVYLPTLAVHMLLAVVCLPLLFYVLLLASTRPVAEIPETPHRRVGRVAASLWFVSFTLGDVVYALLYVVY